MADDLDDLDYRPRNPWPARLGALFVVVFGVCGVAGWLFMREPETETNRILVAVSIEADGETATWWSPERRQDGTRVAGRLHDAITKGFDVIDLDVVGRETPRALSELQGGGDSPNERKIAGKLGAAWLLTGTVKATSVAPIAETEWKEYTFDASLSLVPTTGRQPAVELPSPVRFRSRGKTELGAVSRIVDDIAKLAAPPALDVLAEQPRIQHYADAEGLSVQEQIVADQLRRLFRYSADRREALAAHAEREEKGADFERSWGLDPATRIGPWLGWEVMIGAVGPGRIALKVDELRPELPIGDRSVELVEVHETVVVANEDGTERTRIFDTYNFYGQPRASADGKWVFGVLDERGLALTMVRISTEDGEVLKLRSHDEHYFSSPTPTPDGSAIAYWWQPCRGCPAELRVMPIDTLHPTTIFHNVEGTIGTPNWTADGQAVVVSVVPRGRPGSVWAVSVADGEKTLLAGPGDGQRGDSYAGADLTPDGKTVVAIETDSKGTDHVVRFDVADPKPEQLFHGDVRYVRLSPDGAKVALQYVPEDSWYTEIAVIDLASGAMERLTQTPERSDYLGGWSAGSDAVYTAQEERGETQFYRTYRNPLP